MEGPMEALTGSLEAGCREASVDCTASATSPLVVATMDSAAAPAAAVDSDMLARFEALSNMFKSEVEVLFGKEKETAREDLVRLQEHALALEEALASERQEAAATASSIRQFVLRRQQTHFARVFSPGADVAGDDSESSGALVLAEPLALSAAELHSIVDAFLEVNGGEVRPELEEAETKLHELRTQTEADAAEIRRLREELADARKLKTQEERELLEFKALREKESEVQNAKIELQLLQAQLDELRTQNKQLASQAAQQQAVLKEKSEKIIDLLKQQDQRGEQLRLLSDENNTLRLELGRDLDYLKVVAQPADPLSYSCAAGDLAEDLRSEELRLEEELRGQAARFPGLTGTGNCRQWSELQISRVSTLYRSFLHRLQDYRSTFPEGVKVEFISQTKEVDSEWTQQEELMREAGVEFQEAEKVHTRRWEEHRLKLTSERDAKVRQLLEQAERSQSKAEQQLLLHQAKLFAQRIDAQVERAWEEQRKERDLRWAEHQHRRQEARQRLKDESLSMHQRKEDRASSSGRFMDLADSRLAGVEDTWLRNMEKASALTASSVKSGDLGELLRSAFGRDSQLKLPMRGSQHTGLGLVLDRVEEMLRARAELRDQLRAELEEHSLQQLRSCVEKFIQREAAQQRPGRPNEEEAPPDYSQASAMVALLRMRQHRHLSDALRRQFYDYLIVLRVCSAAALWLLPESTAVALGGGGRLAARDLPPLPAGMASGSSICAAQPGAVECEEIAAVGVPDDQAVEGSLLYSSLCHMLLERTLTLLSCLQRDELLGLKCSYAAEQRTVLVHLCQLEGDMVSQVIQQDLAEYELRISSRLLADTEHRVCEQRKLLSSQVGSEVTLHVAVYRRTLQEQEQVIVRERRKWLTDKLVVLQANGAVSPGDRAMLQRLRQELRACEAKLERFEQEAAAAVRPPSAPPSRPASAGRRPTAAATSPRGEPPAKPASQPLAEVLPSPRQAQRYQPQPSATGQALGPAPQVPPCTSPCAVPAPPSSGGAPARPPVAPASPRLPLPQFGRLAQQSEFPRFSRPTQSPEFGSRPEQQPPLYEWPFDLCSEPAEGSGLVAPPGAARSLSAPRLMPLKAMPRSQLAMAGPLGCVADLGGGVGAALVTPLLEPCLKPAGRLRGVPPLLPPVQTPRA